jgi:hypothetical protein
MDFESLVQNLFGISKEVIFLLKIGFENWYLKIHWKWKFENAFLTFWAARLTSGPSAEAGPSSPARLPPVSPARRARRARPRQELRAPWPPCAVADEHLDAGGPRTLDLKTPHPRPCLHSLPNSLSPFFHLENPNGRAARHRSAAVSPAPDSPWL